MGQGTTEGNHGTAVRAPVPKSYVDTLSDSGAGTRWDCTVVVCQARGQQNIRVRILCYVMLCRVIWGHSPAHVAQKTENAPACRVSWTDLYALPAATARDPRPLLLLHTPLLLFRLFLHLHLHISLLSGISRCIVVVVGHVCAQGTRLACGSGNVAGMRLRERGWHAAQGTRLACGSRPLSESQSRGRQSTARIAGVRSIRKKQLAAVLGWVPSTAVHDGKLHGYAGLTYPLHGFGHILW